MKKINDDTHSLYSHNSMSCIDAKRVETDRKRLLDELMSRRMMVSSKSIHSQRLTHPPDDALQEDHTFQSPSELSNNIPTKDKESSFKPFNRLKIHSSDKGQHFMELDKISRKIPILDSINQKKIDKKDLYQGIAISNVPGSLVRSQSAFVFGDEFSKSLSKIYSFRMDPHYPKHRHLPLFAIKRMGLNYDAGNKYASLELVINDPDMNLLKAVYTTCQINQVDNLSKLFLNIFEYNNNILDKIVDLIHFEVDQQKDIGTLFRGNSLTTRLMGHYAKRVGLPYLKTIIAPVMLEAFEDISLGLHTYEIDPSRIHKGDSLETNIMDLKHLMHQFFNHIVNSGPMMPTPFMKICYTLRACTKKLFPQASFLVVGGFFFLRYICPAIVSPEGYHMFDGKISQPQRRMLILVSKVLQAVSNECPFSEKEEFMGCMNSVFDDHLEKIKKFFDQQAILPSEDMPDNVPTLIMDENEYVAALKGAYQCLKKIKDKLSKHLKDLDKDLAQTISSIDELPLQ